MHWLEAVHHSPQEMAVRVMKDGRRMLRFPDGEGVIERSGRHGFRRAEQEQLEGFTDWPPALKEAQDE